MRQHLSLDIDYHPGTAALDRVARMLEFAGVQYGVRSFGVTEFRPPLLRARVKKMRGLWCVSIVDESGLAVSSGSVPTPDLARVLDDTRRDVFRRTVEDYMKARFGS